jgi:hypothetical protein
MIIPLEPSAAALQVLDAFDSFFQKFYQGRFMDRMHVVILLMSNWCCILQVQTLNPKCLIMRASCDDVVSFLTTRLSQSSINLLQNLLHKQLLLPRLFSPNGSACET